MHYLAQSPVLQALGYSILNSLWQAALLWLLVFFFNHTIFKTSAAKYVNGVFAQLIACIWFIATFIFYYQRCSEILPGHLSYQAINNGIQVMEPEVHDLGSALLYLMIKTEPLLPYLSFAYLLMLLFFIARLTRACYSIKKIKDSYAADIPAEWIGFIESVSARLGIVRKVQTFFSEKVHSPVTIGFLKPVILLPVASMTYLTTEQVEAILLHELAHIKRSDYFINIILVCIETLLFFNPFIQLIGRQVKSERENSCDDWVLHFSYRPEDYAGALLQLAKLQPECTVAMPAVGRKEQLLPRIKRMLQLQEKNNTYLYSLIVFVVITVGLCAAAWVAPQMDPAGSSSSAVTYKVEPLTAEVDNPLFNPAYFFTKPDGDRKAEEIMRDNVTAQNNDVTDMETLTPSNLIQLKISLPEVQAQIADIKQQVAASLQQVADAGKQLNAADLNLDSSLQAGFVHLNLDPDVLQKLVVNAMSDAQPVLNDILKETDSKKMELQVEEMTKNALKLNLDKIIQVGDAKDKMEEQQKADQEKINAAKKRISALSFKTNKSAKPLTVWSDRESDIPFAKGFAVAAPVIDEYANSNMLSYNVSPVAYYKTAVADTAAPQIFIIVQQDVDNSNKADKDLTIQIISNTGATKTYKVNIADYQ